MLALIRTVFSTWTKNTGLAKVYIFPTTLWMKNICRVSRFHPGLFSEHLHSSFIHTRQPGPPSPARPLQGALAVHPVPWSLWSLSEQEKMVPAGGLFFTLSGFLLPRNWNRHLQKQVQLQD